METVNGNSSTHRRALGHIHHDFVRVLPLENLSHRNSDSSDCDLDARRVYRGTRRLKILDGDRDQLSRLKRGGRLTLRGYGQNSRWRRVDNHQYRQAALAAGFRLVRLLHPSACLAEPGK